MPATARTTGLAATAAVLAALALAPSQAHAATCKLTSTEEYNKGGRTGPTYTRSLKVSGGASCATGHRMVKAYYQCRIAAPSPGKAGRCTKRVLGYSCSEKRSNVIRTQYDARVTCRKGGARILTDYTQFT